ncbi:MAG: hypothetical protein LC802_02185 [Acidobacteria bacterium]|nr:hypothetical protein [Acidobacteriota bacterium]
MINLTRIERSTLSTEPYEWALVGGLFAPEDAAALVESYPRDHFKTVRGYDQEKGYEYEARSLVPMGGDAASHVADLSPAWRGLAGDLLQRFSLRRGRVARPARRPQREDRHARLLFQRTLGRDGRRMPLHPALV